jgi:hypothetical protein
LSGPSFGFGGVGAAVFVDCGAVGSQKLPVVVQLLPDASVHVVCPLTVWHSPLFILPVGAEPGPFCGAAAVCWPALPVGLQTLPGLESAGGVGLQTLAGLRGAAGVGLQTLGGL